MAGPNLSTIWKFPCICTFYPPPPPPPPIHIICALCHIISQPFSLFSRFPSLSCQSLPLNLHMLSLSLPPSFNPLIFSLRLCADILSLYIAPTTVHFHPYTFSHSLCILLESIGKGRRRLGLGEQIKRKETPLTLTPDQR